MLKYYIMKNAKNKESLKLLILKILEHKYSCAYEIIQTLKEEEMDFEQNQFYPTLSNLQIQNYLCTNWLRNNKGENIKYYHITRNGYNYIHQ